ncbi:lactoylglutathione lyase [Halobacteriovorax sp. BALOs_7]|nr:lactoylglutathione lyase [Halobacteriovorax sp. BALOs_7]
MDHENSNGHTLELVEPSRDDSDVKSLISKLKSNLYHICYLTNDIDSQIEKLNMEGFITIQEPKPAIAFNNKNVAFLYTKETGIIELLESK